MSELPPPQTVWKFPLRLIEQQVVLMPLGAEVVFVGVQQKAITLWARCDPTALKVPVHVAICGTGHPCPSEGEGEYVGSVLQDTGLVWHVFVNKGKKN